MTSLLFPKQLTEFQFFIRSVGLFGFAIFSIILWATVAAGSHLIFLYGLLGIVLLLKAYHVLCVIGPRFRNIGLEPGFAAFALIPFVGFAIIIGCCFAPAGWWQYATGPTPPPLPLDPGEKIRDEY